MLKLKEAFPGGKISGGGAPRTMLKYIRYNNDKQCRAISNNRYPFS